MRKRAEFAGSALRDSAIVTSEYVASTALNVSSHTAFDIYVTITLGSLTSVQVKFETSNDGVLFGLETDGTLSGSTYTDVGPVHSLSASGTFHYKSSYPFTANYVRASVKGTGTATGSLVEVKAFRTNID